ncbi:three component ABC system middle component [Georgenia satyanarayanai]|uniref:three component ABC system middle component n=1 Tax=Georgenia satyanarayanai TaxID=860221 RepID=UPI001C64D26D
MQQSETPVDGGGRARAPEAVALFNEAFTSELLVNAAWAKEQDSDTGLSWPACFLILPLVLHPPTRESLPRSPSVTLTAWAVRNAELSQSIGARVATTVDQTKRALRFGMRSGRLALSGTDVMAIARPRNPIRNEWPEELTNAVRAARVSGRWFRATDVYTAFNLLGMGN